MTTKRFTIEIDEENFAQILDNNIPIGQYNLCNIINQLHEENQAFKRTLQDEWIKTEEYNHNDTATYHARKNLLITIRDKLGVDMDYIKKAKRDYTSRRVYND